MILLLNWPLRIAIMSSLQHSLVTYAASGRMNLVTTAQPRVEHATPYDTTQTASERGQQ